ncbi:hypothetical protein [Bradyrhizobium iriomotense]|uniref:hypothetical protein n=1 Tax=Bradyrhizobium iriomotense TaxID=441950 RepID=UPI001B89E553|nr:hypothetical protein [Bradyrhizobium iriomotense]MBR1131931.1 hypothetical protein [Bradyrhizobium iriomotense]
MTNDDFLFTEAEFADFVGKSVSWARLLRRQQRAPGHIRVGRTPMYRREAIAEWMHANSVRPGGKPSA